MENARLLKDLDNAVKLYETDSASRRSRWRTTDLRLRHADMDRRF